MKTAILFLILIFLTDLVFGLGLRMYRFPYFDITLHFLGGFFVAMFFASFFENQKITDKPFIATKYSISALIILSATIFIGVFWEFAEYLATIYLRDILAENYGILCCIGNLDDTIGDLALDSFGAITFFFIYLKQFIKINKS